MELRDYQRRCVNSLFDYFERKPDGTPLISVPVGGGKTHISSTFIKEVLECSMNERVLLLAHRKELLAQSYEKLVNTWNEAPVGLFSAGLGLKQLRQITIGGIQSIYKQRSLPPFGLCIVDECHLISSDSGTMFQRLFARLRDANPDLRIVGMSGTPWRMKSGHLCEGEDRLFTDVAYEITIGELIKAGYLVPFVSKVARTEADLSGVHIRGGEFVASEAQEAMDQTDLVAGAVREMLTFGADRRSWLVFCSGVKHAENVRDELRRQGVEAACVFGHTPPAERKRVVEDLRNGHLRAAVNVDVLTVGSDIPCVDLIALLRPTRSPGLYVQCLGRGARLSPETGKENCLVLDFVDAIRTLGPIDDVRPPSSKKKSTGGSAPIKVCPNCCSAVATGVRECPECAYLWPELEVKHYHIASTAPIMSKPIGAPAQTTTKAVTRTTYKVHRKLGKPNSMLVRYYCGLESVAEWVCFEHKMDARNKAERWWNLHSRFANVGVPKTTAEALERLSELRKVETITVRKRGEYEDVVGYCFEDRQNVPERPAA